MKIQSLVIWDLETKPCSRFLCKHVPELLSKAFPGTNVFTSTFLPPITDLTEQPEAVLLRRTSGVGSQQLVNSIKTRWKNTPIFCIFCGKMNSASAPNLKFLEELDDFIYCPFQERDILLRIKRMIYRKDQAVGASKELQSANTLQSEGLIGTSNAFTQAIEKIPLFAKSDAPVLIAGETGTGKELFARAIHYRSMRLSKPFIPVNCGALPDHLFENEIFGHVKGAYTDAAADQKGLVAEAEEGTLFLDEVDTLSSTGQIKLLRFLQDQKYRPLGSSKFLTANIRILCATNADLKVLVEKNLFREDLFYRLNVLSLTIPPLRLRSEDIPLLIKHFIALYARDTGSSGIEFSSAAIRQLLTHGWPGNVRELEAVIHRTILLRPGTIVDSADLELSPSKPQESEVFTQFQQAKTQTLNTFERTYLSDLLAEFQGNVSHAARAAGKERRSFQRLLKKHGLERQAFTKTEPIH